MKSANLLKGALVLALFLFAAAAWHRFHLLAFFEPARVEALLEGVGPLAPILYMALMAATAVLVPIPGPPLFVIAGALFGPVTGLTRMSLRNFILATLLGSIPMTFVYHGFGSVLKVGTATAVVLGLAIVAVLLALPYLAERYGWKRFRPRLVSRSGEDPCAPSGGEGSKE